MGGSRQRQRFVATLGHLRRPREGSKIRVRPFRCRAIVFQRQQPGVVEELPANVVSRDQKVNRTPRCTI